MRTWITMAGVLACMSGLAVACTSGPGGIGAPCETNADCEGELICDEHEGQASCQEPHGHGETDEATETGHSHETESDTGHSDDSGSETGHSHDSGSETGHSHDSGDATTGGVAGSRPTPTPARQPASTRARG